ncbi:peptidoglycan-binding domain-containing protein [Salinispirillum marinum]|uniref:Peptidoglycan-binding domain-containing protein n=2 Tax=Saccharospirillaceae TaxID=255527 RepID=A0ABV8BBC0_9GAMM
MALRQPMIWLGVLTLLLLLTGCDDLRPQPVESALATLAEDDVQQRLNRALDTLGYANGQVTENLGRTSMRMALRQAQTYLHRLGYYDAPQLGILDPPTIAAIEAYLADTMP